MTLEKINEWSAQRNVREIEREKKKLGEEWERILNGKDEMRRESTKEEMPFFLRNFTSSH